MLFLKVNIVHFFDLATVKSCFHGQWYCPKFFQNYRKSVLLWLEMNYFCTFMAQFNPQCKYHIIIRQENASKLSLAKSLSWQKRIEIAFFMLHISTFERNSNMFGKFEVRFYKHLSNVRPKIVCGFLWISCFNIWSFSKINSKFSFEFLVPSFIRKPESSFFPVQNLNSKSC